MQLSIVIPTYNRPEDLKACIDSILKQDLDPKEFEIIVIDDASGPDKDKGCIFARNSGIEKAKGEIMLTMDDDTELLKNDTLKILLNTFKTNNNIGIVGGIEIRNKDYRNDFQEKDLDFNKIGKITKWGNFYTGFEKLYNVKRLVKVDHVRSAFMAFPKKLYEQIGGFEEIYNADGMGFRYETDFCLKIKNLGFDIVVQPEIKVWHKASPRKAGFARAKGERYLLLSTRNHMFFMLKFFWFRHPFFWFLYDFLIGNYKTPGVFYLLRRKELSFSNIKTIRMGKKQGHNMYLNYILKHKLDREDIVWHKGFDVDNRCKHVERMASGSLVPKFFYQYIARDFEKDKSEVVLDFLSYNGELGICLEMLKSKDLEKIILSELSSKGIEYIKQRYLSIFGENNLFDYSIRPFEHRNLDAVVIRERLELFKDKKKVLKQIKQTLKEHGKLYILCLNKSFIDFYCLRKKIKRDYSLGRNWNIGPEKRTSFNKYMCMFNDLGFRVEKVFGFNNIFNRYIRRRIFHGNKSKYCDNLFFILKK